MKPLTREWVQKAEGDWSAASVLRQSNPAHPDHVAYLAQQCAEKYLKAVLQERDVRFPYVHDLTRLSVLLVPAISAIDSIVSQLTDLSQLGLLARYPSFAVTHEHAQSAVETARLVRDACRRELGLPAA